MPLTFSEKNDSFILPKDRPTDRQYAAIGRVAATWSVVELALERILSGLALAPSLLGFVLTDKLGPDNRINAIRSLIGVHQEKYGCELVDEPILTELKTILKTIAKMKEDRNFVVHTVWSQAGADHLGHINISAAARSGRDYSSGPAERLVDIEVFADEIQKAADRLWQLARQIPAVDALLLDKLQNRERTNRRLPHSHSTRQYQRRAYTRA
jgi:hypothetical protein